LAAVSVYPRYFRVAKETRSSGIVAYISVTKEDNVNEIGVSGRWELSSSLDLFKRRLWTLRVPSKEVGLTSPVEERSSTSADARTDMTKVIVFLKACLWNYREFGGKI
jgi:hypothetical protein